MDYVQNEIMSMINEYKRAISEKKNLIITKKMKGIAAAKFSLRC